MVSSLHRTILRIHTMYAAERRDFILVQHTEEEELANKLVPGVILLYIVIDPILIQRRKSHVSRCF